MNAVQKYLSTIGTKGGKRKSKAKAQAAIENGKLGGRPKRGLNRNSPAAKRQARTSTLRSGREIRTDWRAGY